MLFPPSAYTRAFPLLFASCDIIQPSCITCPSAVSANGAAELVFASSPVT